MSKQGLQKAAFDASGISVEESLEATAMEPSLFERIGEEGIRELSTRFYDKVFADKDNPWFLNIFSSSSKNEAIEHQHLFFVQTFGGPPLYQAKKGKYTRLAGRHANYVSPGQ
jgi:truncated hemoglobin YjbI